MSTLSMKAWVSRPILPSVTEHLSPSSRHSAPDA